MKPQINQIYDVEISDFGIHGEGIGKIEGFTLFVEGALPGEKVKVRITSVKPNYAKGDLISWNEESTDRVKPVCPLFGTCGGCQIMHIAYEKGIEWKERHVREALKRIGKVKDPHVFPCRPSSPLFYRNKVQMPLSEREGKRVIGFYEKGSHRVVDVKECFIHDKIGETVYHNVREEIIQSQISFYVEERQKGELRHILIRSSSLEKGALILLITTKPVTKEIKALAKKLIQIEGVKGVLHGKNARNDNTVFPEGITLLEGNRVIYEEILGIRVQLSSVSFFQVHLKCAEEIYKKAFSLANVKEGDFVLDLYCGIGTFALYLAKQNVHVTGIEIVEEAIRDAKANQDLNKLKATFIAGKAEEKIGGLPNQDVVFVNPPRKGCDPVVLESIVKMGPRKVIYTSCQPATLARDIAYFIENGYEMKEAHPFDLFPQTMHVETVCLLEKIY